MSSLQGDESPTQRGHGTYHSGCHSSSYLFACRRSSSVEWNLYEGKDVFSLLLRVPNAHIMVSAQ